MELKRAEIIASPASKDRVRLVGEVSYGAGASNSEEYWFDVPQCFAESLDTTGDPWLAALLPLAVTLGEPLRIAEPVDGHLLKNVHRVMHIWRSWYPHLTVVPIEAGVSHHRNGHQLERTAAFFSCGVDSFFTALSPFDDLGSDARMSLDDLITVGGLDIPLDRGEAFARLLGRSRRVADELGKGLVDVTTNLRQTRWSEADWEYLAHGCGLAGIALALGRRYSTVLIPAGGGYRDLHPWASHPLTDPLLSTADTALIHDGATATRVEKMRRLAIEPVALRTLRVCFVSRSEQNCGACNKCYRTMLTLELLDTLSECTTFPQESVDLGQLARVYCARPEDFREFRDLKKLALEKGRPDVARAAERAMQSSRHLTWKLGVARALRRGPVVRRWAGRLERGLLAGRIV